jgi:hypothetical protein
LWSRRYSFFNAQLSLRNARYGFHRVSAILAQCSLQLFEGPLQFAQGMRYPRAMPVTSFFMPGFSRAVPVTVFTASVLSSPRACYHFCNPSLSSPNWRYRFTALLAVRTNGLKRPSAELFITGMCNLLPGIGTGGSSEPDRETKTGQPD